ncbi:hypothetical protein VP142E351_P0054 [Vibrio phage 142E35-1]|nr:hypothetical protein VP142E351_P0054 [Vibrio phage 142E35-1]
MNIDPKVLSVTLSEVLADIVRNNHTVEEIAMSTYVANLLTTTKDRGLRYCLRDGKSKYLFCGFNIYTYKEWPENVIRVFDQSYRLLALIEINDDGTTNTSVITDSE